MPHGIDSEPNKEDLAAHAPTNGSGDAVVLGYVKDTTVAEGETKVYATDANGNRVFTLYLKNDGTCEFGGNADNLVRYSALKSEYDKTKEVVDIISNTLKNWVAVPSDGGAALKTAYGLAIGSKTTGDISTSKITEIKTS